MKLTKQVKKAMALVLTTALVLSGQTVTKSNAQDTQEPQKEYKATVSTGLAQTETGGTTTTGSAISSTFRTITKTNKDTGEKTHRDIAESGWGDGKGIVYSFYIGNTDVVEIMKFNQPVLEVTDGDETGVSVVQLVSWKELKKMTDKKIDLTSLKKLYEEGTDNPEDGDWPGILVNVPAGRTISFRLYDAEPNGGNDSQATETPEDTATKLYFGMTDGSYVDYTKEIKLEGNGKYSFTVDNLTGENIKNLGYFEMDGDDNGVRLAMGQITVNGTYSMELDDEVGTASDLCYTELNPFHNSQNGLPNIWNPAGQSDVIAKGENADLVGDGGEGIHLLVNKKYVPITEITYTFTVSGMS